MQKSSDLRHSAPQPNDLPGYLAQQLDVYLRSVGEQADRLDLIVAVSGGLDSTVLVHALAGAFPKERLFPVHFNYHLRGEDSDQDQAFIEVFCRGLGLTCEVIHLDPKEIETGGNIQDWARRARYDGLMQRSRPRPCAVLTAHHAQDQVESILYRILKGYPPHTCTGMRTIQVWKGGRALVRPFLHTGPDAIRRYAEAYSLAWREDSSNATDKYARNRIRHHVLPALETAIGPEWQEGLLSFAGQLAEISFSEANYIDLGAYSNAYVPLNRLVEARYPARVLSILTDRHISPGRADEIVRTLSAGRLKAFRTDLGVFMLDREGDVMFIPQSRLDIRYEVTDLPGSFIVPSGGSVTLEASTAPALAYLPKHAEKGIYYLNLEPPFTLRRPQPQDRIALIGRQGETKVKDFLEKQPSVFIRETAWVLEKDGKIAFLSTGRVARWTAVTAGQPCVKVSY